MHAPALHPIPAALLHVIALATIALGIVLLTSALLDLATRWSLLPHPTEPRSP